MSTDISERSLHGMDKIRKSSYHVDVDSENITIVNLIGSKQLPCLLNRNKARRRVLRQKLCHLLRQSDIILQKTKDFNYKIYVEV